MECRLREREPAGPKTQPKQGTGFVSNTGVQNIKSHTKCIHHRFNVRRKDLPVNRSMPLDRTETRQPKRLRESEEPSVETRLVIKALYRTSFACYRCNTLIVPESSVTRFTVRQTPEGESTVQVKPHTAMVEQDSIFCEKVDRSGVRFMENNIYSPILDIKNKYPRTPFARTICCAKCDLQVGYRVEDEAGSPMELDREGDTRPPYKLVYYKFGRGFVLRPMDPAMLTKALLLIPEKPLAPAVKTFEKTVDNANLWKHLPNFDDKEPSYKDIISISNEKLNAGLRSVALRSLRKGEETVAGIHAKDPESNASPMEHVEHGSNPNTRTPYISFTADPGIALLWALPFGQVTLMSTQLAAGVGTSILSNDNLLLQFREVKGDAYVWAKRDKELLAHSHVPPLALEPLLVRMTQSRGPDFFDFKHKASATTVKFLTNNNNIKVWDELKPVHADMIPTQLNHANRNVVLLTGEDATVSGSPMFALIRIARNYLPSDTSQSLHDAIQNGRTQLEKVRRTFYEEHPTTTALIVYYEFDFFLEQKRKVTEQLPSVLERVPVLLYVWDHSRHERSVQDTVKLLEIARKLDQSGEQ